MMIPGLMSAGTSLPDPETVRDKAAEVLGRPEYRLEPLPDTGDLSLDRLIRFLEWIFTPFRWVFKSLEGLPDALRYLVVIALIVILVVLIVHLTMTFLIAVRRDRPSRTLGAGEIRIVRDPLKFERDARSAAAAGDHLGAIRFLFRATLLRLEQAEERAFRAGVTNREVLRRHRETPVFAPLRLFVETIETRWYGCIDCGPADFAACEAAYLDIVRLAKGKIDAHGP
jgi:hypothetical protein